MTLTLKFRNFQEGKNKTLEDNPQVNFNMSSTFIFFINTVNKVLPFIQGYLYFLFSRSSRSLQQVQHYIYSEKLETKLTYGKFFVFHILPRMILNCLLWTLRYFLCLFLLDFYRSSTLISNSASMPIGCSQSGHTTLASIKL